MAVKFEATTTYVLVIGNLKRTISEEDARALYTHLHARFGNGGGGVRPALVGTLPAAEPPQPLGNYHGPWTKTDERALVSRLAAGRPIENVAKELHRTVASCERKRDELAAIEDTV